AFSPDGKTLASIGGSAGDQAGKVDLWSPGTGKNLDSLDLGRRYNRLFAIAFTPDGKTIAVSGQNSFFGECVQLLDLGLGGFRADFKGSGHWGNVYDLALSP